MGDFLFGSTESGTPTETRGGTERLASQGQQFFDRGNVFARGGAESLIENFGFDPRDLNAGDALSSLLSGGAMRDTLSQFDMALRPVEDRITDNQVTGLREMFGTLGGRFGRNVAQGEADLRTQLGEGFQRQRADFIGAQQQQQLQALGQLMQMFQAAGGLNQQRLNTLAGFFAPGQPVQREGALGPLIGAGGSVLAARQLGGA